MAAVIKWTMPFKSFNGMSCRVDIYDENFPPGATPLSLTGTDDPFYFEDNEDDDLLNSVVRYRTGYLRIINDGLKEQSNLYPTDTFDRYVEVYYGSELVFNGYIQVLSFSNELVPTPKVISLPVISPLGLFDKRRFNNTEFLPPRMTTLAELLDMALRGQKYNNVYCPMDSGTGAYGYPNPVSFRMSVHSLAISPWNDEFHHSMTTGARNKVMAPETYYYLIESICKAFGWICHDTPDALIFTAFDWEGEYVRYPVGSIGDLDERETITIPSSNVLTNNFTPADNDANIELLLPETGIEVNYEGYFGVEDLSFDRTTFVNVELDQYGDTRQRMCFCNLHPVTTEFVSGYSTLQFETGTSLIEPGKGVVAWNGYEGILISFDDSWGNQMEIIKIRFYRKKVTNVSWGIEFDIMNGGGLWTLNSADSEFLNKNYIRASLTDNTDDYLEYSFKYYHGNVGDTNEPLPEHYLVFIHNIRFEPQKDSVPYAEYQYPPAGDSDTIPERTNTSNPVMSTSIDMSLSLYRMNNYLIGGNLLSTKITTYPYLFQPRQKLVSHFRVISALTIPYARMFSYIGKNWRMIAQEFHPWNDEYKLTLQNSTILENNQQ